MKILHLIYTEGMAGAERYLMNLLPELKFHDIHCHVILVTPEHTLHLFEAYRDQMNLMGIPTTIIVSKKTGFLKAAKLIGRYTKQHDIQILHSHLINSDILAIMTRMLFNRKIIGISTKHGYEEKVMIHYFDHQASIDPEPYKVSKDFYFYAAKFTIQRIKFNYTISHVIAKLYSDVGLTRSKMPVINHGIKVKVENKTNITFRFSDKQLVIVARLEEVKGHRYLLEAMPTILSKFASTKLLIIGSGSKENEFVQIVDKLHLQKNILFIGYSEDPWSYIANSDIVVLPSIFEAFGLVYIEAFALAKPIVAFDTAAGNEIMENNETAFLVPARSITGLAEKIIFLLENPEVAEQMAARAYNKYKQSFTSEVMAKSTAKYYQQTLPLQ